MSTNDPTLPSHPIRQRMVEAIAVEHAIRVADERDEESLSIASRQADEAVASHKRAVDEFNRTPMRGRPSPLPGQPRSIWTA